MNKSQMDQRYRLVAQEQRNWERDVTSYTRVTKMAKYAYVSEAMKKFILSRRSEIRAKYPQYQRIFTAIDEELNYVTL